MSDKEKALGIGAAILAIAALFLLLNRGGSKTIVQNNSAPAPQSVTVQNVTFAPRAPFTLPPLTVGERWQGLSAIGACCADCSGSAPRQTAPANPTSGFTLVFNEGNRGPNVFNYIQPNPPAINPSWSNRPTMILRGR